MLRYFLCLLSLSAIAWVVGCAEKPKAEIVPSLEPVSGKVTLDGKPVAGVSVTFYPAGSNKGNPASGSTDAGGSYTLTYRTGTAGVPAGDYVALFSKLTMPDGSPIPEGTMAADANAVEQIPERYRATDNPQYMVSVPQGGKTFDFDLQSK